MLGSGRRYSPVSGIFLIKREERRGGGPHGPEIVEYRWFFEQERDYGAELLSKIDEVDLARKDLWETGPLGVEDCVIWCMCKEEISKLASAVAIDYIHQ